MHVMVMGDKPWKTDRVKKGQRLIEIQLGDLMVIGGQSFRVVRRLGGGKLVVRQYGEGHGRGGFETHQYDISMHENEG